MLRCLVLLICALVAVQAAIVHRRDIPVEVVYDKEGQKALVDTVPEHGVRNLDEKIALTPDEVKKDEKEAEKLPLAPAPEKKDEINSGEKNLDEKTQLSAEEQGQALKHLPLTEDVVPLLKSQPLFPQPVQQSIIQQAQEIILSGLKSLKEKIDTDEKGLKPSATEWENLNKSVEKLLEEQAQNLQLKQESPTTAAPVQNQNNQNQIIQNIVNGFSNLTSIFQQNFQQQNKPPGGSEDEQTGGQQPGFFQNFINQFQGGVNQVVTNLQNMNGASSTQSTVLGDTGVTPSTDRPNFINNIVNTFQQAFQGNNNQGNPIQAIAANLNQSDEGVATTARPPNNGPGQIFQNIGNQIGNFFGQGNNNNKPPGSEDEGTASSTSAPNFIQSIGQVFQGVFRPDNSQAGQGSQGGQSGQSGSNPVNVVNNQIQQLVDNANAGGSGNPVESIQNALGGGSASSTEKAKLDADLSMASTTPVKEEKQKEIMMTME